MARMKGPEGRRFRFGSTLRLEHSLSLAAFLMSLGIALINAYYALRGPEIAAVGPTQMLVYRDGDGPDSVLTFAIRTELINVASDYGDVLREAVLSLDSHGVALDYQGTLKTVFLSPGTKGPDSCELGYRCLTLPGLLVVEQPDEMLDLPGGGAKALNFSFPAVAWNCAGAAGRCKQLADFDQAVRAQAGRSITATLRLRFHEDGERSFTCRSRTFDANYLRKVGWISIPCEETDGESA